MVTFLIFILVATVSSVQYEPGSLARIAIGDTDLAVFGFAFVSSIKDSGDYHWIV